MSAKSRGPDSYKPAPSFLQGPWSIPPKWFAGRQVFILGGSPWLKPHHVSAIKGKGAVIAINNAYQLAPFADALFWADSPWLRWNLERLTDARAAGQLNMELITRIDPQCARVRQWAVRIMRHDTDSALSTDPHALAGWDGGSNALNLAFLGSPERIILMGFEGRPSGNWHNQHLTVTAPNTFDRYIIPSFTRMAEAMKRLNGPPVFNCTPNSALSCFPYRELGDFL